MSSTSEQPNKPWTFRAHKKEIITGVVVTLLLTAGTFIWNNISDGSEELLARQRIKETLQNYADDINNNTFDATRYFANTVPVFFEDRDRTPRLINNFWQSKFLSLFENYQARFDFSTLEVDCGDELHCASVILYSDYFNTQKQRQFTNEKSRYDLKFDKEFRIVEVTQVVGEEVEVR